MKQKSKNTQTGKRNVQPPQPTGREAGRSRPEAAKSEGKPGLSEVKPGASEGKPAQTPKKG